MRTFKEIFTINSKVLLTSILAIIVLGIGCNVKDKNDSPGSKNGKNIKTEKQNHLEKIPTGLIQSLLEKTGEETKAAKISIFKDGISFEIQDPQIPKDLFEYRYKYGKLWGPIPSTTRLPDESALEQRLFKLKDVKLDKIPELLKTAREKVSDIDKEKIRYKKGISVHSVVIEKKVYDDPSQITMSFNYTGTGHLKTDLDGKILEFRKP